MRAVKIIIIILLITLSTGASRIAISSGAPGSKENDGERKDESELAMRTPDYEPGDEQQQEGTGEGYVIEDVTIEEEDQEIDGGDHNGIISNGVGSTGENKIAVSPENGHAVEKVSSGETSISEIAVAEIPNGVAPAEERAEAKLIVKKSADKEVVKKNSERKAIIPVPKALPDLEEFSTPLLTGPIEIPATLIARIEGPALEPLKVDPAVIARDNEVKKYMALMTLEQKIGQRFIANIEGSDLSDKIIRMIREEYISGIIIYPWNIKNKRQVKKLTRGIQKTAQQNDPPVNLFISVDQEGGRVNAFGFNEMAHFPAAYYWSQYEDPEFVEAAAYVINKEIAELGCNMNFAPVLDLYGIPDKTVIGDRSMGSDPDMIAEFGKRYVKGAQKAGVIPVIKHFPGHGSSTVDSHVDLPVIDMEERDLQERDFKPFREVIENGIDVVMTAHVIFRKIDPEYPGTLSEKILRGILRDQFGFQGVIISDGLSMGAISNNYEMDETLILLFKAGVDLILVHSKYDLVELKKRVYNLYEQGEITDAEIDEGVERVLKLKFKTGLVPQ
jgi:beta-N-acetylhexosaminidase